MHLVRVRHLFYPDLPKDYIFELSKKQAILGYDLDLVTWNKGKRHVATETIEGFKIRRVSGPNLAFGPGVTDYPFTPQLGKVISSLHPEVVHAESHLFLTTLFAIKAANEMRTPSIVTVHGVTARRSALLNLSQQAYITTIGRRVFSGASRVVCLSKSDAAEIVRYGCPKGKISMVPNGVDLEIFKPTGGPRDELVVWTGRMVPEKGLPDLLKAAKIVSVERNKVKFFLIGSGPEIKRLQGLARELRLTPQNLVFCGEVQRAEIAQILKKATIFAFPSLKEGLPVSLIEAMASGNPIVATRIPSIEQVITDGEDGLLVPPRDFKALASTIKSLLADAELRIRLGENARRTAVARYSMETVVKRLDEIYREVRESRA